MHPEHATETFASLCTTLCEEEALEKYRALADSYAPSFIPRLLGSWLVWCGNVVYGYTPSYLKFRAVEVIARVPYHSWASAAFTLLTLGYTNEVRALRLSKITSFARVAQDNETMHVIVVSKLAKEETHAGFIRYTLIPMLFAFFYFWWSYLLFLINPRYSYELNYLFENHAFHQYGLFLEENAEALRSKKVESAFLSWYGRTPANQYEFFTSVRNDELIHRNSSISAIKGEY